MEPSTSLTCVHVWVVKVVKCQTAKENTSPLCSDHSCERGTSRSTGAVGVVAAAGGVVTFQTSLKQFAAAGRTAVDRVKRGIYYKANEWRSRERRILAAPAQPDSHRLSLQLNYSPRVTQSYKCPVEPVKTRVSNTKTKKNKTKNTACEATSVQPCVANVA